jgi:hypothetical protein
VRAAPAKSRSGGQHAAVLRDEDLNFAVLLALGFVYHGTADAGEVLATIEPAPEVAAAPQSPSRRSPRSAATLPPSPPDRAAGSRP